MDRLLWRRGLAVKQKCPAARVQQAKAGIRMKSVTAA
jgi:hypothetical protein